MWSVVTISIRERCDGKALAFPSNVRNATAFRSSERIYKDLPKALPKYTKIELQFDSSTDANFEKVAKGRSRIIRIYSYLRFKTANGKFTKPYPAIVDTGAYVSVIPHKIWSACDTKLIGKYRMSGLVAKEECTVPVLVGEITGKLVDMRKCTDEYRFMAYFTITDEFPLIIGFRELLENVRLYVDYRAEKAWIEEIKRETE